MFRRFLTRIRIANDRLNEQGPTLQWAIVAFIYTTMAVTPIMGMLLSPIVPWMPDWTTSVPLSVLQIVTFGAAAAALWAAYRYARVNVVMTNAWWMSSWARRTIVGSFAVLAVGEFTFNLIEGHLLRAVLNSALDVALAYYWWTQWGDGGRGWDDEDFPILPDDPEDHGKDVPVDPVLVEMPNAEVRPLPAAEDENVRGVA